MHHRKKNHSKYGKIVLAILILSSLLKLYAYLTISCHISLLDPNYIQNASRALYTVVNPFTFRDCCRPPGYHTLISILMEIFGEREYKHYMWLFQLFMTTVMSYMLYLIGKEAFNEKTGVIACLLTAFYPSFTVYSFMLFTDLIFTVIGSIVFYLVLREQRLDDTRNIALAGFVAGLWCFIRIVPFFFLTFIGIWIALVNYKDKRSSVNKFIVFMACALVLIIPWSVGLSMRTGNPMILSRAGMAVNINKGFTYHNSITIIDGPLADFLVIGPEREKRSINCYKLIGQKRSIFDQGIICHTVNFAKFFVQDPVWLFSKFHYNFKSYLLPDFLTIRGLLKGCSLRNRESLKLVYTTSSLYYVFILILSVIGLLATRIDKRKGLMILFMSYVLIVHLSTISAARFRLPITPLLILFGSSVIADPIKILGRLKARPLILLLLILALIYIIAFEHTQITYTLNYSRLFVKL